MAAKGHSLTVFVGDEQTGKSKIFEHLTGKVRGDISEYHPTIDCRYHYFETDTSNLTLVDTPGKDRYAKNLCRGAFLHQHSFYVASCDPEYIEKLETAMTQANPMLMKITYIVTQSHFITTVLMTKVDLINYSEEKYNECVEVVKRYFKKFYNTVKLMDFIPVCGNTGGNILQKVDKLAWYHGPTLREVLFDLPVSVSYYCDPLVMAIVKVKKVVGIGKIAIARISRGHLKVGMNLSFDGGRFQGVCSSIHVANQAVEEAEAGQLVCFRTANIDLMELKSGVGVQHHQEKKVGVMATKLRIDYIQLDTFELTKGFKPLSMVSGKTVRAQFKSLLTKFNPRTRAVLENRPKIIKKKEGGTMDILLEYPALVTIFKEDMNLGKIVFLDKNKMVGAGIITHIDPKDFDSV